jgi:hypothetical protein
MESKNEMTRKQFLVLTFSLVGTTAAMGSCDDDDNTVTGTAGSSGTGRGGTTGTGGSAGTTGTGGGGGTNAAACTDPLPETQVADATQHTHTVVVAASALNATTAQTFTTDAVPGHSHMITLEPTQLTTLKGGGTVTVTSTSAGAPAHTHMYTIRCT